MRILDPKNTTNRIPVSFSELNTFVLTGVLTSRKTKHIYILSQENNDFEVRFEEKLSDLPDMTGCKAYIQGYLEFNAKEKAILNIEYIQAYLPNGNLKYESQTYPS